MDTFGARLLAARNKAGRTQQDLAQAIGTSVGRVSLWECGKSEPEGVDRLRRIADYLGCSAAWLAFGDGAGGESVPPPAA